MDPVVSRSIIKIINDAFDGRIPNTDGVLESVISLGEDCGKDGKDPLVWQWLGEYAQAAYDTLYADVWISNQVEFGPMPYEDEMPF